MNKLKAIQSIRYFDQKGKFVFSKQDMRKLFPEDTPKTLEAGLNRLVQSGLLARACKGVYVNPYAKSMDSYTIEHIAKVLRRGKYSYVSLESALSEYGLISQIPIDRLTIMTTGREGLYKTSYGMIEFTHTKRSVIDILNSFQKIKGRPLRVATQKAAVRDLKRVGRNINLLHLGKDDDERN
ncbi:MAG: hypothetical protein K0R24_1097 [Gammaproteobacteria bacterium]|jgi:predicted transcriptional regulator of viral defense system|nr:hypothetical protein [Gammaproteobacteria bacterium]MCE3238116.1 hypothetical protein [Gammaproteobacteria bacterium]